MRRVDPDLGALTLLGAATFVLATDAVSGGLSARAGFAAHGPEGGRLRHLERFLVTVLGRSRTNG